MSTKEKELNNELGTDLTNHILELTKRSEVFVWYLRVKLL